MSDDALHLLTELLGRENGHSLPADVRSGIALTLARALIARGELDHACRVLDSITPTATEERREVVAQRLRVARKQAEQVQRQKRWPQAARAWQKVVELDPTDGSAYLSLGRAYEHQSDYAEALETYVRLAEAVPTARTYLTLAPRFEELAESLPAGSESRQIRAALVGNATLDQLTSFLTVECYRAGLRPIVYQAGFDQLVQQVLDPASGLYTFNADVVIWAMHASRVFPRIHHDPFELSLEERRAEIEDGFTLLQQLLDTFTQRSSATVLLHNMVAPQHPALGIADLREELGQAELFAEINRRLSELARTRYRTVYILDEDRVQAQTGKAIATDPRLWLTARVSWSEPMHLALAREYMRYLRPLRGLTRKCVVLDLDNTLWGGVIGEDGPDGIQLGADAPGNAFVAFQRELERLWRRGILLAVASKNNYEDVAPAFESHPGMVLKWSHIAAHRINWRQKAQNIQELAAELNIGLDSLVFLDDNPVERAAIRAELPDVLVPELPADPAHYRDALLELDVFESLGLTAEDRQRGKLYAEQAERRAFETAAEGRSIEDYLARLNMVVEITAADATNLTRVAQLTNKTNQFNLTTRRYTEGDIVALQDTGHDVYAMRVSDRFGDNGLVGVAILSPNIGGAREIDTLLMSCRVMGRGVESALVAYLAEQSRALDAHTLRGRFIPTAKNVPARDVYSQLGFVLVDQDADGSQTWELDLTRGDLKPAPWLTITIVGATSGPPTVAA